MPLPRVNFFKMIHMAIRGMLGELTISAGKADYADFRQVEALYSSTLAMNEFLKAHAKREDTFVHPVLEEKKFPGIVSLNQEHMQSEEKLSSLVSNISDFKDSHANLLPEHRIEKGYNFYLSMAMFQAFYFTHMNNEETNVMPFVWSVMSNEEVFSIYMAIQSSVSEEETLKTISSIFPYIDFSQALKLVRIFQAECPTYFEEMLKEIEKCLEPGVCSELFKQAGVVSTKTSDVGMYAVSDTKRVKIADDSKFRPATPC